MENKAIYTYVNGRKTFVGKRIKDSIHREFDFSKYIVKIVKFSRTPYVKNEITLNEQEEYGV